MIRIGTSGWVYDDWKGVLYPEDAAPDSLLGRYAEIFSTVEINNTFYHLPSTQAVADWHDGVPDGFLFAVKASRYITHVKHLREPAKTTAQFFERIAGLGDRLGPILFQLRPRWHANTRRIAEFLAALPPGQRYVFEFRDPTWHCDEVFEILADHGCGFCIHDHPAAPAPERITADFAYLRLHRSPSDPDGCYTNAELTAWAERLRAWDQQGLDVFCYFNNDWRGYAVDNARALRRLVGTEN